MSTPRVENAIVKSKSELRNERRAKQEAQRAVKSMGKIVNQQAGRGKETAISMKNVNESASKPEKKEEKETKIVTDFHIKQPTQFINSRPQEARRVHLFKHLDQPDKRSNVIGELGLGSCSSIHLSFLALGVDLDEGRVWGSNKCCLSFLLALENLVRFFQPDMFAESFGSHLNSKETLFCRAFGIILQTHMDFLNLCRPLAVTIRNAYQYIKQTLQRLDSLDDWEECRIGLLSAIEDFRRDSIYLAGTEIEYRTAALIRPGECICTFGYSSLVAQVLERAWHGISSTLSNNSNETNTNSIDSNKVTRTQNKTRICPFSVLIVDSRPTYEGRRMLIRLTKAGIPCEYTHIGAFPSLAHKISLVIVGAHALLSNGYVIARIGTGQVANIGAFIADAPILVCAETYKFWERAYSDAFEYNELKDPDDVWRGPRGKSSNYLDGLPGYGLYGLPNRLGTSVTNLSDWRSNPNLNLLHLAYDILPPTLVTAVVTEKGILPTTSVPVLLRVKQASIIPV